MQPAWLLCPILPRSLPTSAHSAQPLRNRTSGPRGGGSPAWVGGHPWRI